MAGARCFVSYAAGVHRVATIDKAYGKIMAVRRVDLLRIMQFAVRRYSYGRTDRSIPRAHSLSDQGPAVIPNHPQAAISNPETKRKTALSGTPSRQHT